MLGLPLMIVLTLPSDDGPDAAALNNRQPVTSWKGLERSPGSESQAETIMKLLIAKQAVHAVILGQATDQLPHEFPHSGLWDASGKTENFSLTDCAAAATVSYVAGPSRCHMKNNRWPALAPRPDAARFEEKALLFNLWRNGRRSGSRSSLFSAPTLFK